MSDYYIRRPDSDEVRGPFNLDKLATLAEAGQIDRDTLYYDEAKQDWIPLDSNESLRTGVFAEKRRFGLQPTEDNASFTTLPTEKSVSLEDAIRAEVKVDDMLAAAEGATGKTKNVIAERRLDAKILGFTPVILGGLMTASAILLAWHDLDKLHTASQTKEILPLLRDPLVIVGTIDFIFAVLLFLWVSEVYPVLRARMAVGTGLLAYIAWSDENTGWLLANLVAGVSIFIITLSPRARVTLSAIVAATVAFVWMFGQKFFS